MGSSKRQTTMAKLTRERKVLEKRQLKQERKEERKAAAAREAAGESAPDEAASADEGEAEPST